MKKKQLIVLLVALFMPFLCKNAYARQTVQVNLTFYQKVSSYNVSMPQSHYKYKLQSQDAPMPIGTSHGEIIYDMSAQDQERTIDLHYSKPGLYHYFLSNEQGQQCYHICILVDYDQQGKLQGHALLPVNRNGYKEENMVFHITNKHTQSKQVKTGDKTPIIIWIIVMLLTFIMMACLIILGMRKDDDYNENQ